MEKSKGVLMRDLNFKMTELDALSHPDTVNLFEAWHAK